MMTTNIFTSQEVIAISAEIDRQLSELRTESESEYQPKEAKTPHTLPLKQSQMVAKITKEQPEVFLKKFALATKSDLCEEGGVLNTQWKKWADLRNQDVIEKFGHALVTLGFAEDELHMLVITLAVIVLHIGVKIFCVNYS